MGARAQGLSVQIQNFQEHALSNHTGTFMVSQAYKLYSEEELSYRDEATEHSRTRGIPE